MNNNRLYKAIKNNARNKIVFAIPDREDATELADDMIRGLANPQVKLVREHLNHLIIDTRESSTTRSAGTNQSASATYTATATNGNSQSAAIGRSQTTNQSFGRSYNRSRSFQRGQNTAIARGQSDSFSENGSQSETESQSYSRQEQRGTATSETRHEYDRDSEIVAGARRDVTEGQSRAVSENVSGTRSWHDSHGWSESHSQSHQETYGYQTALTWSRGRSRSEQHGSSEGVSLSNTRTSAASSSIARGSAEQHGISQSEAVTDQPGTRHIPFLEKDPVYWSLQEQRWRAAEFIMHQPLGHWFASTANDYGPGTTPLPRPFYITPKELERQLQRLYSEHCLTPEQADAILEDRRRQLFARAAGIAVVPAPAAVEIIPARRRTAWNRATSEEE